MGGSSEGPATPGAVSYPMHGTSALRAQWLWHQTTGPQPLGCGVLLSESTFNGHVMELISVRCFITQVENYLLVGMRSLFTLIVHMLC